MPFFPPLFSLLPFLALSVDHAAISRIGFTSEKQQHWKGKIRLCPTKKHIKGYLVGSKFPEKSVLRQLHYIYAISN